MKYHRLTVVIVCLLTSVISFFGASKITEVGKLRQHIQYLEEYIEDNGLPTPAMRIK